MTGWWATVGTAIAVLVLIAFLLAAAAVTVDAVCRDRLPTRPRRSAMPCHPDEASPPSPGWRPPDCWPATQGDLRLLWRQHLSDSGAIRSGIETILKEIKKMAANVTELKKDISRLADGYVAQQAKIALLEKALEEADAVKAQAVADAIAADDAIDQAAIDEADALVEGVSPEPSPEPEPAPEG